MYRSQSILPQYAPSQAFNGLGEYFVPNGANGLGEYFTPNRGMGEYFVPNGLGKFTQAAAGITGIGNVGTPCPMGICGLGQEVVDPESMDQASRGGSGLVGLGLVGAAISIGVLAGWIYMGYHIGKDLSPPGRNWGVGGAFMSLLGPFAHWGYGVMALTNKR